MNKIRPIHTKEDHESALAEIERLWDAEPGTPRHDKLEVLATLVDAYERQNMPIPPPNPIDAIRFAMEQRGFTRKDLEPLIGTRARVSEVLTGRRGLTLVMIRNVNREWNVPLEALVAESVQPKAHRSTRARRGAK